MLLVAAETPLQADFRIMRRQAMERLSMVRMLEGDTCRFLARWTTTTCTSHHAYNTHLDCIVIVVSLIMRTHLCLGFAFCCM
jgi:hypothetical protein